MADGEFLPIAGLTESAAERRVIKQGIVPETSLAPGRVEDAALHCAAVYPEDRLTFHQGDQADKARGAVPGAPQLLEQQAIVRLIGCLRARKPRGINARCSVQGIHFQARVVGEQQPGRMPAVVASLEDGILLEGRSVFHAGRNLAIIRQQFNFDWCVPGGQAKLPQLSAIAGGAEQPRQIFVTFF